LHQAICVSLQVEHPSGNRWAEFGSTWYLGDYYDVASKRYYPVYLTYRAAMLTDTISSLCRLHSDPFILLTTSGRGLALEVKQLLEKNNLILLSMADELGLQPDGSFKPVRCIAECINPSNQPGQQRYQSKILPIEAYRYLAYNE